MKENSMHALGWIIISKLVMPRVMKLYLRLLSQTMFSIVFENVIKMGKRWRQNSKEK